MGDPLEKAAIASSGWSYAADVAVSGDRKARATILQRYHFNSTIKRMAAVVSWAAPPPGLRSMALSAHL